MPLLKFLFIFYFVEIENSSIYLLWANERGAFIKLSMITVRPVRLRRRWEAKLEVAELNGWRDQDGQHITCFGDKSREAKLRQSGRVQRRDSEYISRMMVRMELYRFPWSIHHSPKQQTVKDDLCLMRTLWLWAKSLTSLCPCVCVSRELLTFHLFWHDYPHPLSPRPIMHAGRNSKDLSRPRHAKHTEQRAIFQRKKG